MSLYSLPVIILNLGGEMFYVLDQRLRAQNIPLIRAQRVLNEITATFLNEKFLHEIFKPQPIYNKQELYLLFRDIAHASIMKLNDISMGKLYDLMVMVFKHQIYFSRQPRDLLLITLNHLDSLRNLVSAPGVYKQLDSVYCLFMKVYFPMYEAELQRIRYDLLNYFQDIHIKVSVFLRLGQQNDDGTFVHSSVESIPHGHEIPGVIKVFNGDESIKDVITFPVGAEYTHEQEKSCYDLKGKRGTTLGLSIYREKSLVQDFAWSTEDNINSQILVNSKACDYRSEIKTLMSQLLGNKKENDAKETILLDLFADTQSESDKSTDPKEKIQTVTLCDLPNRRSTVLETIASEVSVGLEYHDDPNNLFNLLENTE